MAEQQRGIVVTGEGSAEGRPDIAYVTVGVETRFPELETAREQAALRMQAVLDALRSTGVEEKDVYTDHYGIDQDDEQHVYRVAHTVRVTVRDLSKAGDVLDRALEAGANRSYGISFDIEDRNPLEDAARQQAAQDAQRKAARLAELMGVKLGPPKYIEESWGGRGRRSLARAATPMLIESTPVSVGELDVSLIITVRYGIK